MRRLAQLTMTLALALGGCDAYSSDGGDDGAGRGGGPDAGAGGGGGPCVDGRVDYPAGPFGTGEGDTVANLVFTDADGAAVDFAALRASCEQRLLLVSTAAGWCTACREEQPKLQSLHRDFAARGLVVLVAYFEDDNFAPGTVEQVAAWRRRYSLTFPVVLDEDFALGAYYDRELTPMTLLVDLESMSIVKTMTGYDDVLVRRLVRARL